jgi:hypothetical protein
MPYRFRPGLGADIPLPAGTFDAAQAQMFPGYCSWLPFADFMSACQVPTIAQVQASNASNVGPGLSPDAAAQLQAQIQQTDQADCAANPDSCAQFTFAGSNPTTAAILGSGTVGQAAGGLEAAAGTAGSAAATLASFFTSQWAWFGLAAILALYFIPQRGR